MKLENNTFRNNVQLQVLAIVCAYKTFLFLKKNPIADKNGFTILSQMTPLQITLVQKVAAIRDML